MDRTVNGLAAVKIYARNSDNNGPRTPPINREACCQARVGGDCCAALYAQTLAAAGNQETNGNAGIANDIAQALDSIVAVLVGDQERLFIMDSHEAGGVAARRTIHTGSPTVASVRYGATSIKARYGAISVSVSLATAAQAGAS